MGMSGILVGMVAVSLVCALATGRGAELTAAAMEGASAGVELCLNMAGALCLWTGVMEVLRRAGAMGWLSLLLVRPVSGSAALGVGADLIRTYGPDSTVGRTAAVMLGSTETTFYTVAVYFSAAGIKKTRYAVPAALCADLAGFVSAAWAVRLFFPT